MINFVITVCLLILGGLFFFYIEHCYVPTPRPLDGHEISYNKICSEANDIQQNRTNNFTTTSNTSSSTLLNDKKIQMKIDIADHTIKMCLEFPPKNNVRQCNISIPATWEWFDYTASVAFTTGTINNFFSSLFIYFSSVLCNVSFVF